MLSVPEIARVQDKNLAQALQKIVDHVNKGSSMLRFDPSGTYPAPKAVAAMSVLGGAGEADVQLTDNAAAASGRVLPITYFVEYSTDYLFADPAPYTVSLGPSRNARLKVAPQKLYWRAYSQYFGSLPSTPVVFGGDAPIQVDHTAGASPATQAPQGSGGGGAAAGMATGYGINAWTP